MAIDHRKNIDILTRSKIEAGIEGKEGGIFTLSEEELLGLKFKPGDKVVDTITGKEGIILAGQRASHTIQGTQKERGEGVPD